MLSNLASLVAAVAAAAAAAVLTLPVAAATDLPIAPAGAIRFEDATPESGIQFTHSFGARKLGSLLESTGAGCVWFDYNNDGRPDLYVVSDKPLDASMHPYPLRQPPAAPVHNHLYRNDGNGKFTDVTEQAGVGGDLFSMSATAADFDNDGNTDLLVTGYGRVILFRNKGDGSFEDVTERVGLKVPGWSIGAAWIDYDRDGCPDVFIGRYVKFDPKYRAFYPADNYPGPLDYQAESGMLFHNSCHGTFTDVSEKSGIAAAKGRAMGVTAGDFDGDGFTDIYVANDKTESFLFHNKHDGTFEEIAVAANVAYGQNGENSSAMGPVLADIDNDGRPELWVSDSKYNRLLKQSKPLQFDDITPPSGISQLTAQYVSWGTGLEDFDNDGLRDLFVAHGGLIHLVPQEHSIFRNLGNDRFEDVTAQAGPFFAKKTVGRGACFADYDNDGKVDAFLVNLGGPAYLLHNTSPGNQHWLSLKLVGKKSGRDALGAKVELTTKSGKQFAERSAGSGYLSQDDGRLHFGLGTAAGVDEVKIAWPSGATQILKNVTADRVLTVKEK